jgi:hypothetical protein
MTIKVTQAHIDSGAPNNSTQCPIALALDECGFEDVEVTPFYIKLRGKGLFKREIDLPNEVTKRIVHFDKEFTMEPFEFELPYELV